VLLLSIAVAAGQARAQSDEVAQARALVVQSQKEFNLGNYEAALELVEKAYRIKPANAALYNIAQCHRLLGHFEQARRVYKAYLAGAQPGDALIPPAEEQLAQVEAKLEKAPRQAGSNGPKVAFSAPAAFADADGKVAVLVPRNGSGDLALKMAPLRDGMRASIKRVLPSARPLAPETLEQIARANNRDLAECDSLCEVDTGRLLQVDLLVNGEVTRAGARLRFTARLLEIASSELIAEASVEGDSAEELVAKMAPLAEELFSPLGAHLAREGEDRAAAGQGVVSVRSNPVANVRIDGRPTGLSPLQRGLDPGPHFVELRAAGRKAFTTQIEINAGATVTVAPALVAEHGFVELSVAPADAALTIDEQAVKPGRRELSTGKHLLRAVRAGFETLEQPVIVRAEVTQPLAIVLKAHTGLVVVNARQEVVCTIDGAGPKRAMPEVPLPMPAVPGRHTLKCMRQGFADFSAAVSLAPDQSVPVEVSLVDLSARSSSIRNAAIAGGLAVVAGGLAGYGFMSASGARSDLLAEKMPVDLSLRQDRFGKIDSGNKLIVIGSVAAGALALVTVLFLTTGY
jgi:tetratricopeptide (TPR) repeat protein